MKRQANIDATVKLKSKHLPPASQANAKPGNLVHVKTEGNKNEVRPLYIVTKINDDATVSIQKLLHSLDSMQPGKLMAKPYIVKQTEIYLAANQPNQPNPPQTVSLNDSIVPKPPTISFKSIKKDASPKLKTKSSYFPPTPTFSDSDTDSEDPQPKNLRIAHNIVPPLDPQEPDPILIPEPEDLAPEPPDNQNDAPEPPHNQIPAPEPPDDQIPAPEHPDDVEPEPPDPELPVTGPAVNPPVNIQPLSSHSSIDDEAQDTDIDEDDDVFHPLAPPERTAASRANRLITNIVDYEERPLDDERPPPSRHLSQIDGNYTLPSDTSNPHESRSSIASIESLNWDHSLPSPAAYSTTLPTFLSSSQLIPTRPSFPCSPIIFPCSPPHQINTENIPEDTHIGDPLQELSNMVNELIADEPHETDEPSLEAPRPPIFLGRFYSVSLNQTEPNDSSEVNQSSSEQAEDATEYIY